VRAAAPDRVIRVAQGDACLTVVGTGASLATRVAPCDRVDNPAEQRWTIVDAPRAAGAAAVALRSAAGGCLSWQGTLHASCDDPSAALFIRRRFSVDGNVWTVAPAASAGHCLRATSPSSIDWPSGTDCEDTPELLIWRIEDVVPLDQTSTITVAGRCLGVRGGHGYSAAAGRAELRDCGPGQLDQRWQLVPVTEGGAPTPYVQLRNAWKGLCLEVGEFDNHGEGAHVALYMCDGGGLPSKDSHWELVAVSATVRHLRNRISGLAATASSSVAGASLVVTALDPAAATARFTAPATFWPAP
jgi:hypothetical protein